MTTPRQPQSPGEIRADAVYTLQEALSRLRWGRKTLATAKRHGLKVLVLGRVGYVRGRDVLALFDRLADGTQE